MSLKGSPELVVINVAFAAGVTSSEQLLQL